MDEQEFLNFKPSLLAWSFTDLLIFEHDIRQGSITYYRSNGESYTTNKHESCSSCPCKGAEVIRKRLKEMGESELPPEKIEDADEFTKIFNDEIKTVSMITDEEILQRILQMETVIRQARTRVQAANFNLNERKKNMTKTQREALALKDKEYRVKPEEKKEEKKKPMNPEEKAIAAVMKMLKLDYDAAKKWLDENGN